MRRHTSMSSLAFMQIALAVCVLLVSFAVSPSHATVDPPAFVTVGVCYDMSHPYFKTDMLAIDYAMQLVNNDTSVLPATNIYYTWEDCGSTYASGYAAAKHLIRVGGVIAIFGGSSDTSAAGVSQACTEEKKPFLATRSTLYALNNPANRGDPSPNPYLLRLTPTNYNMAQSIWDFQFFYVNPSYNTVAATPEQVYIHVIWSDDTSSKDAAKYLTSNLKNIIYQGTDHVLIRTQTEVQFLTAGRDDVALQNQLKNIRNNFQRNGSNIVWFYSAPSPAGATAAQSSNIIDRVLAIASATTYEPTAGSPYYSADAKTQTSVSMLQGAVWMLNEVTFNYVKNQQTCAQTSGVVSDRPTKCLAELCHGCLGTLRSDGYVNIDTMFSNLPVPYVGNWQQYTTALAAYQISTPSLVAGQAAPDGCATGCAFDIYTKIAFDLMRTFAKGMTSLLATASNGKVYERGDLIYKDLLQVSFVGASGPICFTPTGDRKTVRTAYGQIISATALSYLKPEDALKYGTIPANGYNEVGHWTPLGGPDLNGENVLFTDLGGNFLLQDYPLLTNDQGLVYSAMSLSYTWNSIPVFGSPPPIRYGHCQMYSAKYDTLIIIGGTQSSASIPLIDVWRWSFVTSSWQQMPVLGTKPDARYYGSCTVTGDFIYYYGGISDQGIKGDVWRFQISTNQWYQILLPKDLAGVSRRAQFGSVSTADYMGVIGGRHLPTINPEFWSFSTASELFDKREIIYDSASIYTPGFSYSADDELSVSDNLSSLIGGIVATTQFGGKDVILILGGYAFTLDVAFVYDPDTNLVTPLQLTAPTNLPVNGDGVQSVLGGRSLTKGVIVDQWLYVNHGWDQFAGGNYRDVFRLNLRCPGTDCGKWQWWGDYVDHRDSLTTTVFGTDLIQFAGWGALNVHNDFHIMSTTKQNYTQQVHGDFYNPPGRKFSSICVIGSSMLLFGGLGDDLAAHSETYLLDVYLQTWTPFAAGNSPPSARYGHSAASIRLEMYVFGGQDVSSNFFLDLSIYSIYTNDWNILTVDKIGATVDETWPRARAFHVSFDVQDQFVYVFGGQDKLGNYMGDLWAWNVQTTSWRLEHISNQTAAAGQVSANPMTVPTINPGDPPLAWYATSPVTQAAAVYDPSSGFFYHLGGLDSGYNPVNYCFFYDILHVYPTSDSSDAVNSEHWWVIQPLIRPLSSSSAAILSSVIYLYGGLNYEDVSNSLYIYKIAQRTWSEQDTTYSWNRPRGFAGGSMLAFGNSIIIFGGSSTEFNAVHAKKFVLSELWQFTAGLACSTADVQSLAGSNCSYCSPGTTPHLQTCIPCAAGTYWVLDPNGRTGQCVPCSEGFYGSLTGASSYALCIPCANGTYANVTGASVCFNCSNTEYCPVGSSVVLTNRFTSSLISFYQTQPIPFKPNSSTVSDQTAKLSYALAGAIAFGFFIYLAITCGVCGKKAIDTMPMIDVLYQFNHLQLEDKPMIRRRTPLGGYCTLYCLLLVCYLIVVLTLPFTQDNILETRSLVPNVAVNNTFRTSVVAQVKLNGYASSSCVDQSDEPDGSVSYSGNCVQDTLDKLGRKTPGIEVYMENGADAFTGYNAANFTCQSVVDTSFRAGNFTLPKTNASAPTINGPSRSCLVTWNCGECGAKTIEENLHFDFHAADTFATSIEWLFSTGGGYPDQYSVLYGIAYSEDDRYFRGIVNPTEIGIFLTQTLYQETVTNFTGTGYHLNYVSTTPGDKTFPRDFYSTNGIEVKFALQVQLNTMNIVRTLKQTTAQFIGALLGSVSGVIGGVAALMGQAELIEDTVFQSKKKGWEKKGTSGLLMKIFARNDAKVVADAEARAEAAISRRLNSLGITGPIQQVIQQNLPAGYVPGSPKASPSHSPAPHGRSISPVSLNGEPSQKHGNGMGDVNETALASPSDISLAHLSPAAAAEASSNPPQFQSIVVHHAHDSAIDIEGSSSLPDNAH